MTRPVRIQLSRRKGFSLQAASRAINGLPAVVVARPTRWGNPWTVAGLRQEGRDGSDADLRAICADRFRRAVLGFRSNGSLCGSVAHPDSVIGRIIAEAPADLAGRNLACWCPSGPCHADALIELANGEDGA